VGRWGDGEMGKMRKRGRGEVPPLCSLLPCFFPMPHALCPMSQSLVHELLREYYSEYYFLGCKVFDLRFLFY